MGLSKEEFLELMVRNEFGKKTTKRNKAIREGRQKENDYNNFRFEGREKNIKRGNILWQEHPRKILKTE